MKWAVAMTVLFLLISVAFGQRKAQSLSYSSLELHIGDDEQATVKQLREKQYKVTLLSPENQSKGLANYFVENGSQTVGVMTFRNGKLVKAYRDWTPSEDSSYSLVMALRGAIQAMKSEGPCQLDTEAVQEPNYSNQASYVICGNKYIQITGIESSELSPKRAVSIYEWLDDGSAK